jgi:Ca-activated chloride channel family protein
MLRSSRLRASAFLAAASVVISTVGCALSNPGFLPGPIGGADPGGAQDIAQARAAIARGKIPEPAAITVEGLLSEHSIESVPPANPGHLYVTAAATWNADYASFTPLADVVIGFGTTIDLATFERAPQNLCLVIDQSGSMNEFVDPLSGVSKLAAVKVAVDRLLSQLTSEDRVSVVTFNDVIRVGVQDVAGSDVATIKAAINELLPSGSTDLARGMIRGYRVVKETARAGLQDRIIVFTDAIPTTGTLDADDMLEAMNQYAAEDVGATILGFGQNFGSQLAVDISQVRGGNFYFIGTYERIERLFDDEFRFMVTPVAYDVELAVSVPVGFDVNDVYGIPYDDALRNELLLKVPTLFLSGRETGGGVVVRLRASALTDLSQNNLLASIAYKYTPVGGGQTTFATSAQLPASVGEEPGQAYFEHAGAKRTVLLTNLALTLKAACDEATTERYYYGEDEDAYDPSAALARLDGFLAYFDEMADSLPDKLSDSSRSLAEERALIVALRENIASYYSL